MAFSLLVWCVLWEIFGRLGVIDLIPPFTQVLAAFGEVIPSADFVEAATITFHAFTIGMAMALVVGVGVGILMGSIPAVG